MNWVYFKYSGKGGMGKTTTIKMLALEWAENHREYSKESLAAKPLRTKIQRFDFVFLVLMREIENNISLEALILQQHAELKENHVSEENIRSILRGPDRCRVLLILDGYDEYRKGVNTDIDAAIRSENNNYSLIVTSRPGYLNYAFRKQFDEEVNIKGFDEDNFQEYVGQHGRSEEDAKKLIVTGISNKLLRVPILLLMSCVLHEEGSLPRHKIDIIQKMYRRILDRAAENYFGRKSSEVENLTNWLDILGKLSWEALQGETRQLLINQVKFFLGS